MKKDEISITDRPHIKVLIIEDNDEHAELICRILSKAENIYFDTERAGLLSSGVDLLGKKNFDVILSDLGLPDSKGIETFETFHSLYPAIPVIVVTSLDDENTALSAVQGGAQDYLVKGQIYARQLIRSIQYAIERRKLITELEKSLKEIKTLQELLPICAWCRNIRDDKGYWKNLETYIRENTDTTFTHGICPKCMKKVEGELLCKELSKEKPDFQEQKRRQDEQPSNDK